jgi:dihydrofolate synthase / folylpolyglutamate synthase
MEIRALAPVESPGAPSKPSFGLGGMRNRYPLTVLGETIHVDSPLWGDHQRRNIALAIAAAVELRNHHGYTITSAHIEAGIRNTEWPGRLELFTLQTPPALSSATPDSDFPNAERRTPNAVLLDVAHNPAGIWTLRAALSSLSAELCAPSPVLVFGCMHDKAFAEMAQILFPLFSLVVATPVASPRSATAEELAAAAAHTGVRAVAASDPHAAFERALTDAPPGALIVVAGSVYLVGEVRQLLLARGATPGTQP